MRHLIALALALTIAAAVTPAAHAAPAEQGCSYPQPDVAGTYVSTEHQMRVELFSCGESWVMWDNAYGRHIATYASYDRLVGHGVMALGVDGPFLDNSWKIAFKAAERGYIQVATFKPYDDTVVVYRLRKIA